MQNVGFPSDAVNNALSNLLLNEQPHGKTNNLHMRNQRRRSRSNCKADQPVFATQIVQFLYFLIPKFPASSHLLWRLRLVCVRPVLIRWLKLFLFYCVCFGSVTLRRKPLCRKDTSPKQHFAECDTSPKYCRNSAKMPKKMFLRVFHTM